MDWQQLMQAVGPYLGAMPSQPAPAQQAQGMPGQPQQAPKMQYGMGDIVGSPALQGALDAYFGYLARPRGPYTNRWQGLGQAGVMGLQGFEQARANQLQAPMLAAELQKTQAEAAKTGMETQDLQQQMQMRKAMVDQFDKSPEAAKMPPLWRMGARQAILQGKATPETFGIMSPYQKGELEMRNKDYQEKLRKDTADIEKGQEDVALKRQEVGIAGAGLGIREAELGIAKGHLTLQQQQDAWRRQMGAGTGPITPKEEATLAKQAHDMAVKDAGPAPKPPTGLGGFIGRHTGGDAAAVQAYQQQLKQWQANVKGLEAGDEAKLMNDLSANRGARRAAAVSGGDEEGDSIPDHMDPSGKRHHYKGTGDPTDPANWDPVP